MVQIFDLVLAAMRRHASLSSCVLLACLLLAPGASAQGGVDDPQVDPDSPAGTEYELPIDRARDRARGGGSGGSGGTSGAAGGQAPLFGEGVEEEQAPRSGGESSTAKEAPSEQTPSSSGGADPPRTAGERPATSAPEVARVQAPAPETGGGQLATPAAIAAGVLLIGGLAGLLLRRRSDR